MQIAGSKASFAVLGAAAALAACAEPASEQIAQPERDPIVEQALNDHLMVDPDLAFQNEGNAALTIGFDHSIPPIDARPETVAMIRDAARIRLLEGGEVLDLPTPVVKEGVSTLGNAITAGERASLLPETRDCADRLDNSAIWAARLPGFAEILPRGAVVDAAGSNSGECRLRVVTYRTPLPPEEALQFHFTLLWRADFEPRYVAVGETETGIRGSKRSTHAAIHAHPSLDGLTEIDIVTFERE